MIDPNEKLAINALSELFLDTDVEQRYGYVAEQCIASGLSDESLQDLLLIDVAPICGRNLTALAGEWAGFDEDDLMGAVEARRAKGGSARKLSFLGKSYAMKHWRKVQTKMAEFRAESDG